MWINRQSKVVSNGPGWKMKFEYLRSEIGPTGNLNRADRAENKYTSLPYKIFYASIILLICCSLIFSVKPDSTITYNFTYLDQLVYEFWKNELFIGFELMGNPSNHFSDFENVTQVYFWKDLVRTLAKHYIGE